MPTTISISDVANKVLEEWIKSEELRTGTRPHKSKLSSNAILKEFFPKLPSELQAEILEKYPIVHLIVFGTPLY